MRWDNLLEEGDAGEERAKLPLFREDAVVRRFKTPEFRGMTFYEVRARSIINHVKGDRLGFNYTINTFRGCSHACQYCLSSQTPILMADGRTKPISDVRAGDRVYGTVFDGKWRRYATTDVLAHWQTRKEAYRLTLEDGTELIASGDHRFLSNRGWKYVTGAEHGRKRRPFLTLNNKLMGVGHFPGPPSHTTDYRRGYLCGLIRGDANLAIYGYTRPNGREGRINSFRLALTDLEPLIRAQAFLRDLNVETRGYVFKEATATTRQIDAIATGAAIGVTSIMESVRWPDLASPDWCKGFLAGIYDAEGGFNLGIFRIYNTDPEIISWTRECLSRFGFKHVLEVRPGTNKPVFVVRLLGELSEKLRFFIMVDPAITRKRTFEGMAIKSSARLGVASIEPLGRRLRMYDITTGTGDFIANGAVSHNCFARPTHTYLDFNAGKDFENQIVVKTNAAQLLHNELRRKSWGGEAIAMGTNTDPYQRAEGHYKLMRGIIKELNAVRNPYSILTKGTLIKRDIDLLEEGASVTDVNTCFSVGTVDEKVWKETEPGTPHPLKRLEVLRKLNEAGVPCGVLMAPVLPGISDSPEQLKATVEAIVSAGATFLAPLVLHLRPGVKEEFMPWLEDNHPELVARYEAIYKGRSYYAPKDIQEPVTKSVANLKAKFGFKEADQSRHRRGSEGTDDKKKAETQMSLDLDALETRRVPKWVYKSS